MLYLKYQITTYMKTNKITKVDKFFRLLLIKTYKAVFHLLGLTVFASQIFLFGYKEFFTFDKNILPFQLALIALNLFVVNYLLDKLGIDKLMEQEKEKLTK